MAAKKSKPSFELEEALYREGHFFIAGIDEVGRGSLAGPIVAGAVIFSKEYFSDKKLSNKLVIPALERTKRQFIDDSKKLTQEQREEFVKVIMEHALDTGIGEVSAAEIDLMGIGKANILAFKRAIDKLKNCDFALIDGRHFRGFDMNYKTVEKGDSKSISIAAASIIAKVYRDNLMKSIDDGIYDFADHKGYGNPDHIEAIRKNGPCPHHRRSFIRNIWTNQDSLF